MKKTLSLIWPFVRPYRYRALIGFLFALPLAGIKGIQAYLVKDIFDKGFDPNSTLEDTLILAAILVGLALLSYPLRFVHFYQVKTVMERVSCDIRAQLHRKFQFLPLKFFNNNKQGRLLSVAISDTMLFSEGFKCCIDVIREPLTAICLLGVAFYHDWRLTFIILAVFPFFILIFYKTGRLERGLTVKVQEQVAEMTHGLSESLVGQKIIKAFNLQDFMNHRYLVSQNRYLQLKKQAIKVEEHSHPLVELIGAIAFAAVIVFAHYRIASGELTAGGFLSFTAALALFMDPIRKFSSANVRINQARAAGERIHDILDLPDEDSLEKENIKQNQGKTEFVSIEIKNLSFGYDEKTVLKNFSLTINKGERVALVGLSGSGKSTLVNLLLRLYTVPDNSIFLNGVDINQIALSNLRDHFSLVSQDLFLFNDSVLENLKSGDDYSDEEIHQALTLSHCLEFTDKLPEGLDTIVGDRGVRLSGGQAQRLTMARAFLKDRPVLLFDEATSALDNESEKVVQSAMDEVSSHSTVLAVAHRLSTIQNYDKIAVLRDGEKIEEGRHEELLQKQGEYYKLYQLSSKEETQA